MAAGQKPISNEARAAGAWGIVACALSLFVVELLGKGLGGLLSGEFAGTAIFGMGPATGRSAHEAGATILLVGIVLGVPCVYGFYRMLRFLHLRGRGR